MSNKIMKKDIKKNSQLKQPNQHTNYSVDKNGVGYISQAETARLCGVSANAIFKINSKVTDKLNQTGGSSSVIKSGAYKGITHKQAGANINQFGQLSDLLFQKVLLFYTSKGNPQAVKTSSKFMLYGIRSAINEIVLGSNINEQSMIEESITEIKELKEEIQNKDKEIKETINDNKKLLLDIASRKLSRNSHSILMVLAKTGIVNHSVVWVKKHFYELTPLGRSLGFEQKTMHGKIICPAEAKLLKDLSNESSIDKIMTTVSRYNTNNQMALI